MVVCSVFTLPSTWAIDKFGIRFGVRFLKYEFPKNCFVFVDFNWRLVEFGWRIISGD
jgi:hypothetical protein